MLRFVRFGLMGTALCGLFLCGAARASGQVGAIIGTGTFTSSVENMDRSLAFYHDVFDMEVPPLPESGERPYNRAIHSCLRCSTSQGRESGTSPRGWLAPD